jgi:hypothetical protein
MISVSIQLAKASLSQRSSPPVHGHQVPEPLVRQLVGHHVGEGPLLADGGVLAEEQEAVAEGDRAGVLHRARAEVRHREDVELGVGVGDAEVVLEGGEDARRVLHGVGEALALPARRHPSEGQGRRPDVVGGDGRLDEVEGPDGEGDQVGGQGLGALEADA